MDTIIPAIPSDWIDYGTIKVSPGYRPICAVLHKVDGYHGLAIHRAYVYDGNWVYEHGTYFHVNDLENARKALFAHRDYVA